MRAERPQTTIPTERRKGCEMTQVARFEVIIGKFPFVKKFLPQGLPTGSSIRLLPYSPEVFFSRVSQQGAGSSSSRHHLFDGSGIEIVRDAHNVQEIRVEELILSEKKQGRSTAYILSVEVDGSSLTLYVPPSGCDDISEYMTPLLAKEREAARAHLEQQVANLYVTPPMVTERGYIPGRNDLPLPVPFAPARPTGETRLECVIPK